MKTPELYQEDFRILPWFRKPKWLWYWWTWKLVTWLANKIGRPYIWNGGRRTDGDPTVCEDCLHVYRVRDCLHGYMFSGEDVEASDGCPNCGKEI